MVKKKVKEKQVSTFRYMVQYRSRRKLFYEEMRSRTGTGNCFKRLTSYLWWELVGAKFRSVETPTTAQYLGRGCNVRCLMDW